MSVMPIARGLVMAVAAVLAASACADSTTTDKGKKETPVSEDSAQSRTVDGYTYTTDPVIARLGPHRYAFPANLYDDQIGPSIGGGVALTLMWPELKAAPPGSRGARSMIDHYRSITMAIDHVDAIPISTLLARQTSTDATSEEGSVYRDDPSERLDLRIPGEKEFGLTPYAIDEMRMSSFADRFEREVGTAFKRNPRFEDDWYVARDDTGELTTFIKCDQVKDGRDGIKLDGGQITQTGHPVVAICDHHFVDSDSSLAVTLHYPRILLRDWKAIEDAARMVLEEHKID